MTHLKTSFLFQLKTLRAFILPWAFLVSLTLSGAETNLEAATNSVAAPVIQQSQTQVSSRAAKEKKEEPLILRVMSLSIAILAIVMGIGIGFFAIWCDYRKRKDLLAVCHQERIAALEKGLEIPPFPRELMDDSDSCSSTSTSSCSCRGLKGGLIWLGIGVGLAIFLFSVGKKPGISAIPIGLGLAYLAYYVIEGRKMTKDRIEPR